MPPPPQFFVSDSFVAQSENLEGIGIPYRRFDLQCDIIDITEDGVRILMDSIFIAERVNPFFGNALF